MIDTDIDIASISETTKLINIKFHDNIWPTKMCRTIQYCDVNKSKMADGRHFEDR